MRMNLPWAASYGALKGAVTMALKLGAVGLGVWMVSGLSPADAYVPAPAGVVSSQQEGLQKLQGYLNALTTFEAKIRQTNPNGTVFTGQIYMMRQTPTRYGKLRLTYDPPAKDLIVVDGENLLHKDLETGEVSTYDVTATPAGLLLQKSIHFSKDVFVKNIIVNPHQFILTLTPIDDREGVSLTLFFDRQPFLILKGWQVLDHQQNTTTVDLADVHIGMPLDPVLFKGTEHR